MTATTRNAMNVDRIWRTTFAGLCGSVAHSGLMLLKSEMGWLPSFQPYHDLQQAVEPTGRRFGRIRSIPWALSFLNGAVLLGFLFGRAYRWLPGDSGAAKGLVFGVLGWIDDGAGVLSDAGARSVRDRAGFGFQPALFSLHDDPVLQRDHGRHLFRAQSRAARRRQDRPLTPRAHSLHIPSPIPASGCRRTPKSPGRKSSCRAGCT